jgi:transcription elongation factor GreA
MDKVPITRIGYHRLVRELVYLRRVVRPEVLEELRESRVYGVKMENQQYLSARERHLALERKIQDIEDKLAHCEIVVGRRFFLKQVEFGALILIKNMESGEVSQYEMVGPYDSDVSDGKLSVESPVGRTLLGHGEGDEVVVYAPSGIRIYKILSIVI